VDIRIPKAILLKGLQFAASIAKKRDFGAQCSNVIIESFGSDAVILSATDLAIHVRIKLSATVKAEGRICIDARQINDLIKSLPDIQIRLRSSQGKDLNIVANQSNYSLPVFDPNNQPERPQFDQIEYESVDSTILATLIPKVLFSISTDSSRPHLGGVYLIADEGVLSLVSTDGHRLSRTQGSWKVGPTISPGVLITKKGILEMRRLLDGAGETTGIHIDHEHVSLRTSNIDLQIRLLDAQFPPYNDVIPSASPKQFVADREELSTSLKRMSILSQNNICGVRFDLSDGSLNLSTSSTEYGEAKESLPVEYTGESLSIGFNAKYVVDALSEIDEEKVCIGLGAELDPAVIYPKIANSEAVKDTLSRGFECVVMPMKI